MSAHVRRMNVTVRELASGWLWAERGRHYKTAAGVVRALKREAKAIVKANPKAAVVQFVEWHTTTEVGKAVATVWAKTMNREEQS